MNWQVKTRVWGRESIDSGWCIQGGQIDRIYYVHSGKINVEFNNKTMQLVPGYLYLIPQSVPFTAYVSDGDIVDHSFFDFVPIPCFLFQNVFQFAVTDYPLLQRWLNFAGEICQTYVDRRWEPEVLDMVNSNIQSLLFVLSQITELPAMKDPRIQDTMLYIQNHLDEMLTVESLASRLFLNKHYFTRLFTYNTGQSPHRYIQNQRMNLAVSLLKMGHSAKETSEACGFGSYCAFARAFQSTYGCPPTQYLQNAKKQIFG